MAAIWKRNDRDIWVVDYRDATGKRRREFAGTREEAEQALAKVIQTATETPLDVRDRDITVKDYGTRCLTSAKGDLAARTYCSYDQLFKRHIEPSLGRKKVRELRRRDVRQFLATKRQAGLGKNSIRLIKATLSTILTQAVEDELLQANPALGRFRGVRPAGVSVTDVNPMDQDQSQRLDATLTRLQAENRLSPVYAIFFLLLHGTGLRPSEARALQPEDLDLRKGTVQVERSADLHGRIKATKTEEPRKVDLSGRLQRRLQDYLSWLDLEAMAKAQSGMLFPGDANGMLDESQLRKVFKWILRQAELPHFRVYDLRHTYASRLLSAGVPLLYVSKQLGHRKPTTTLKYYATWIPSEDRRYVDAMDTALEKLGTSPWHQVDITEKKAMEVVEKFGGPCRGRTYGPLIKSQLLYQLS